MLGRLPVAFACVLAACKHGDGGAAQRTTAVASCADAIEKAAALPAGEQIESLARGCAAACPGLADWSAARDAATYRPGVLIDPADGHPALTALLAGCHPECKEPARLTAGPPAQRWPTVLAGCPGLFAGDPSEASDEAVVLSEVSRWLAHAIPGVSDRQLPVRLEHVTTTASFTLPLPALPGAPAARFRAVSHARQFVRVGDELRVGALPEARLRDGRVDLAPVPGAYPGQVVELDQLAPVLAQHAQLLGGASVAPLVIADASLPLARLLEVVGRLGAERVEVAVDGDVTYAHPVVLERRGTAVAVPEIDLAPTSIELRGFGDDRATDWAHLDDELDHFAAENAPVRAIELIAPAGTTVGDLVKVLDACVVARISAVQFQTR